MRSPPRLRIDAQPTIPAVLAEVIRASTSRAVPPRSLGGTFGAGADIPRSNAMGGSVPERPALCPVAFAPDR